jgi:heterodisulfide reductase subunit C
MTKNEAHQKALSLRDKWEEIVADAFRYGFLRTDLCLGCGKPNCGGCPAGTYTGWDPNLVINKEEL